MLANQQKLANNDCWWWTAGCVSHWAAALNLCDMYVAHMEVTQFEYVLPQVDKMDTQSCYSCQERIADKKENSRKVVDHLWKTVLKNGFCNLISMHAGAVAKSVIT